MRPYRAPAAARRLVSALAFTLALTVGCRVETDKHGGADNVKIATPFGGMSVKTNDEAVLDATGLPAYPGATLIKSERDKGAADINLSFGGFQLRVKAISYHTPDSPTQVSDFYRKALGRFGDVIQCSHNQPVGPTARTAEGLGCDGEKKNPVNVGDTGSSQIELKAGSKVHQHIVDISPDSTGTKFGLVALDLPSHVTLGSEEKDDTRQ